MQTADVVIIGAGAAGLMCAATAAYRGRRVLLLDHANRAGKKILMSGGGRCNFTNLNSTQANFLSANPYFCISALKRYTPQHFFELVERHGVDWCEKAAGQLFCVDKAQPILDLLLTECDWAGVDIRLKTQIQRVEKSAHGFRLATSGGKLECGSLVVATGGLSIPTMGASGFGYQLAEQFGLQVLPTRAGLVPFTLQPEDKQRLADLSGVSLPVAVTCRGQVFQEPLLFTHRGLSGPAMLQISSYWQPGDELEIDLLVDSGLTQADWQQLRQQNPRASVEKQLANHLPKRMATTWCDWHGWQQPLQHLGKADITRLQQALRHWRVKPGGTEGYRTAEVTLGGVDTRQVSQRNFEAKDVPGLHFIGEVLDVTGQLGGHNFQWAWASGYCAGLAV